MSRWLYRQTERSPPLYTVGFFPPGGEWEAELDYASPGDAAKRVHWLNGGNQQGAGEEETTDLDDAGGIVNKDARVHFRVTPSQFRIFRLAAEQEGYRLSEWLRRLANRRVEELAEQRSKEERTK